MLCGQDVASSAPSSKHLTGCAACANLYLNDGCTRLIHATSDRSSVKASFSSRFHLQACQCFGDCTFCASVIFSPSSAPGCSCEGVVDPCNTCCGVSCTCPCENTQQKPLTWVQPLLLLLVTHSGTCPLQSHCMRRLRTEVQHSILCA